MKKIRIITNIFLSMLIFTPFIFKVDAAAYDASNIYAYPVPFNPKNGAKKFMQFKNLPSGSTIEIKIYDINGDMVFEKEFSSPTSVIWNGRNENGIMVRPGLYIIKVTVENKSTGDYGKKLIRILVKY